MKAVESEESGDVGRPVARATYAENRAILGQFLDSLDNLPERNRDCPRKGSQLPLGWLAYVEDCRRIGFDPVLPIGRLNSGYIGHRTIVPAARYDDPVVCPTLPPRRRPEGNLIDIAVLASGSGTNLQALLDTPTVRPHIATVISDRPEATALRRAERAGIDRVVVRYADHPDRTSFSEALADAVLDSGAEGVVLAGFMRVLAPVFVDRFPGRILNIHPSLLPAFPGARAVEAALEHGVKVTGVTVHLVDEKVDNGPIIAQVPVEVLPGDTADTLHERIQAEEHRVYPEVVEAFIAGRIDVVGRKVVVG